MADKIAITHEVDTFLRDGPNKTTLEVERRSLRLGDKIMVCGAPSLAEAERLLNVRIHAVRQGR